MKIDWLRKLIVTSLLIAPLFTRADGTAVSIVNPTNNASFTKPVNVLLQASVTTSSVSNNILRVNFYAGPSVSITTLIGSQMAPDGAGLYDVTWTNPPAGTYSISAVAVDFLEHRATSAPVVVTIKSNVDLIPVITVVATDPAASKSGTNTGTFTVYRTGSTSNPLTAFYGMSGTASNGVDYTTLTGTVTFNAGDASENILLQPLNNPSTTVALAATLELHQPPFGAPTTYIIGEPHTATVYITNDINPPPTNIPPSVHIYTPTNNSSFFEPANIFIGAEAADKDGYVKTVEFFENGISLGVKTNNPASANSINPFYLYWTNVPAGAYGLTALATDDKGATTLSAPVHVTVTPPPPPPTNYPPVVRISSPANGATYHMPVNIPVYVYAFDRDGSIASVEIFAGTNDLGAAHPPCYLTPSPGVECPSNYYTLVWSNALLGTYPITAVGTDNVGATTTSEPVKVTILPPPPPPSNHPPVVNIVATDPIAIEGTNCWTWVAPTNSTTTWSNWMSGAALPCRVYTNCGPKSATFVLHRDGSTNGSLTVNYEIGGTGSNGVDYVTLPGSVTIDAGERSSMITVVPLDDGPPDINSTVILKIKLSTNYTIGTPATGGSVYFGSASTRARRARLRSTVASI